VEKVKKGKGGDIKMRRRGRGRSIKIYGEGEEGEE
jgi:hypothetical protein